MVHPCSLKLLQLLGSFWIGAFSTDKTLVTIGGDFCFDPTTVTTISKVMDTIERNANKVNLVEQIQEFMKKGTWKYQIGGVPKISESIARGAWKSDESWVLFLQGMEAFMAGNIMDANEKITNFLGRFFGEVSFEIKSEVVEKNEEALEKLRQFSSAM